MIFKGEHGPHRFLALLLFLIAGGWIYQSNGLTFAAGTTYYVDYTSGSDSNNGTSEATPWKHAPGMQGLTPAGASTGDGCTANCAAYSGVAGDKIILKGGTVWPYTTAPWTFNAGGSATTSLYGCAGPSCIYVGNAVGAGLAAWNNGTVTSITTSRDLGGWSPSSPPSIVCSGGGGSGAAATPNVIPAANTDAHIAGFIYHITMTNVGSGYTTAPSCVLSGGSGSGTAILSADIDRAIFDLGATQGSPPDWPAGQCGTFPNTCNPGLVSNGNYVRFSGIEVRNARFAANAGGGGINDIDVALVGLGSHNTATNMYVHGMDVDCYHAGSCISYDVAFPAIYIGNPYDEASFDIVENGDFGFLGTSTQAANGICNTNTFCEPFEFGFSTSTQGGLGPASVHNNVSWMNGWQQHIVGNDASGSDPFLSYANEYWLADYMVNFSAHVNSRYTILASPATMISYNNIDHNQVGGTGSQLQCPVGVTYYFYNEVQWTLGTSTQAYSLDMADVGGATGCSMYLYNDTAYTNNGVSVQCVNTQPSSNTTTIVMQNLHCIDSSAPNPFWSTGITNSNYQNSAGSTVQANIQASSIAQSIATANSQGYTTTNLFAPTASTNDTVTFSSGSGTFNLTALCTGNFVALCSDILGNARPATGGWEAGAYRYNGGGAPPPTITVNWTSNQQTMQGFGAGNNFVGTAMNSYDTLFFSTLGYSLLRTSVPLGAASGTSPCDSIQSSCSTGADSITDMTACITNGCSVWGYVSNPPAEYNSSGTFNCTVNPALKPASYGAFATYISNFIASLNTYQSVPLIAMSVQNEPDNSSGCQMSAAQMDTFIKTNLGPTMTTAGQTSTAIMMPETESFGDYTSWAGTCMGDSSCAAYVGINAFHDYDNASSISNSYGKQFWETEVSDIGSPSPVAPGCAGNTWCPGIVDGLMWATIVNNFVSEGVGAWHYFWYVDNDTTYGTDANVALVNPAQSTPIAKRAYTIANWAKFVRPGWVRVSTTYSGGLLVTAFKNSGGTSGAVVVVNSGTSAVVGQPFAVSTLMGSSVTPWITSSTQNLASQSTVTVSGGGFTYTIPAQSVVTFQGGSSGLPQAAPPVLLPAGNTFSSAVTITISDSLVYNQDAANGAAATPITATLGSSVGLYHFLTGWLRDGTTSCPPDALPIASDNGSPGTTWTASQQYNDTSGDQDCMLGVYAPNVLGSPTQVNGAFGGTGAQNNVVVGDFSGVTLTGSLDVAGTGVSGTGVSALTGNSITTIANNDLLRSCLSTNGVTVTGLTVSAGVGSDTWHLFVNSTTRSACAYAHAGTAGARAPHFAWTSGAINTSVITDAFLTSENGYACVTTDGTSPATDGAGGCAGTATKYTLGSTFMISSTKTVKSIVGSTAYTDSPIRTDVFTIQPFQTIIQGGIKLQGGVKLH